MSEPSASRLSPELESLVSRLAAALMHADSNPDGNVLIALHTDLDSQLRRQGVLVLRRAGPFLLVNGKRARPAPHRVVAVRHLLEALATWGMEGVQLEPGIGVDELRALLQLLTAPRDASAVWPGAAARLRDAGVGHVLVHTAADGALNAGRATMSLRVHRDLAHRAYVDAVELRAGLEVEGRGVGPRLRDLKRAVHRLVDLMHEDDAVLVGLTNVKALTDRNAPKAGDTSHCGSLSTHSVNVAILSILLGRAAHRSKQDLAIVGLAALLHDVDVDSYPNATTPPLDGVARLLSLGSLDSVAHPALTLLELRTPASTGAAPSLATRIVQIAHSYELLTRTGAAGQSALPPERALATLQRHAARFDTQLLPLFASALGVYPPGSLVQLDTGETAVVAKAGRDAQLADRPFVRLLLDREGHPCEGETLVDLTRRAPQTRAFARRVQCAIDPAELDDIAPAALCLAPF